MKNTIKKIVSYAILIAEPEEIVLFGSMVNGTANVHSDVDLLIITESRINKSEAVTKIRNHAFQFALKTDVLIYSKLEFEKELSMPDSFIKAVQKSGKTVYKKPLK